MVTTEEAHVTEWEDGAVITRECQEREGAAAVLIKYLQQFPLIYLDIACTALPSTAAH